MKGLLKYVSPLITLVFMVGLLTSCSPADSIGGDLYTWNIYPDGYDTRDLGSPIYEWNAAYIHDLYLGNSLSLGGIVFTSGNITFVEIDPIFTASPSFNITAANITAWNSCNATGFIPYTGASSNINLNAKTVTNGIFDSVVGKGTWTASGTWKLPAMFFNGDITTDRWLGQDSNTFLGVNVAGADNLAHTGGAEGYYNTGFGNSVLSGITTGYYNTAVGGLALSTITTGWFNSAFGTGALLNLQDGIFNTGIGLEALASCVSGQRNTALGMFAGYNTTADDNVFLGYKAGYNELGSGKLYIDNSDTATPLIYGDFSTNALTINGVLSMATHQINNVVDPTLAQDAATKNYVDNAVSGNVSGFVPYTGATTTLDLGVHNLTTTGNITAGNLAIAAWNAKENALTFTDSLNRAGNIITFVGDNATPGNSQYYGTNSTGDKGFFSLPSSAGYVPYTGATTNVSLGSWSLFSPAINGGILANDDITIQGTTSGTRTTSYVSLQPSGGIVSIGAGFDAAILNIQQNISGFYVRALRFLPTLTSQAAGQYAAFLNHPIISGTFTQAETVGIGVDNLVLTGGAKATNMSGILITNQTSASRNVNLNIGSGALPSSSWSIYNDSSYPNYFAGSSIFGSTINMTWHQIKNVTDPSLAQDAATKHYVDTQISGFVPYVGASATLNLGIHNLTTTGKVTAGTLYVANNSTFGGTISLDTPTLLTIAGGVITKTKSFHTVDTEGAAPSDFLDTINGGLIGDELVLSGASDVREVKITRLGNIRFQPQHVIEGFSFNSPSGGSGTFYTAGYYAAPAASVNLTQASPTTTYGTVDSPYGAHAFLVAGGAGVTNAGTVSIVVSGTSITLDGVRAAGSETIVADITTMTLNKYYETTKLWIGQITYTLTPAGGAATYSAAFNWGLAAYDSIDYRLFHITDFEVMGRAGANDPNFDVQLLHHWATGWTYSLAAFVPGDGAICSLATDYAADNDLVTNERFKYERNVDVSIDGLAKEGFLVRIITSANKAVEFMNISVYAEAVPNDFHFKSTGQSARFTYNGAYWMQN